MNALLQARRQVPCEVAALTFAQVRTDLENAITIGQLAESLEAQQNIRRKAPASGAYFQNVPFSERTQDLGALPRHARAEQGRDFGRGRDAAAYAQLVRTRAVVAQARRVQRKIHEPLEREPARGRGDLLGEMRVHER